MFTQIPVGSPLTQTQLIKSWFCLRGTTEWLERRQSSFTQTTLSALTDFPRCCAGSLWVGSGTIGRQSGVGSSPSGWPVRASAARARTLIACWATMTSPGVCSVLTRVTLPGITKWTKTCLRHHGPLGSVCTWTMLPTQWPFIQCQTPWSWSIGFRLSSLNHCMQALVWAPQCPSAS